MGDRYRDIKGSSRPTRDDSRRSKERRRRHSRSRSRSPQQRLSSPTSPKYYDKRERERNDDYIDKGKPSREWEESDEEVPAPPPPPRISKISIGFSKSKAPIKMTIGNMSKSSAPKATVASVFNPDEDDDEPEEMPAEARMRMRNIGRETPTSAGPNSFGKTKQGFCDAKKVFEKNLKEALETAQKPPGKLPQTIYKIKGP